VTDTEDFEAPFVVTLKGGAGYEKPWVVIRGNTAEEAVARLGEAHLHNLLEKAAEYSAAFQALTGGAANQSAPARTASTPSSRPVSQAPAAPQPTAAPPAPQDNQGRAHPEGLACPQCQQVVGYKTITSKKNGKSYNMWVCPNQRTREDGHFSEFV